MAAAEIAHEFGIGEVTVTGICQLGRMGRDSFYGVFDGIGECLRFAFAEGFERIFAGSRESSEEAGPWPERLNAGLERFYKAVAEEPLLAEFCLVHCFGAEQSVGHDYEAAVGALVTLLGSGREDGRERRGTAYREPPPLSEEYLARMIVSLAALRLTQGRATELPGERPEMAKMVISTLSGAEEPVELTTPASAP
jgi:hypothetical protein